MSSRIYAIDSLTGNGIPFASIYGVDEQGRPTGDGLTSNSNGYADIDSVKWFANGADYVEVSSSGYIDGELPLYGIQEEGHIYLDRDEQELGDVVVTNKPKPQDNIIEYLIVGIIILLTTLFSLYLYKQSK